MDSILTNNLPRPKLGNKEPKVLHGGEISQEMGKSKELQSLFPKTKRRFKTFNDIKWVQEWRVAEMKKAGTEILSHETNSSCQQDWDELFWDDKWVWSSEFKAHGRSTYVFIDSFSSQPTEMLTLLTHLLNDRWDCFSIDRITTMLIKFIFILMNFIRESMEIR